MKRKIIKQGLDSLTITLPRYWTDRHNLQPGDELDVTEERGGLYISQKEKPTSKKIEVDISGLEPIIKRYLKVIYKLGYSEINLRFTSFEEMKIAQEVVREEFIGFEIIEHKKNNLIIKEVSRIEPQEFETMIRRVFLIIQEITNDSLTSIKENDKNRLNSIILRDKDVNKITDFCRKILYLKGYIKNKEVSNFYVIIEQLEKISDLYRDLCRHCLKKEISLATDLESFFQDVNQYFSEFYHLFYNFDIKKIVNFVKRKSKIESRVNQLIRTYTEDSRIIFFLNEISNEIFNINGPLMAIHLD